MATSQGVLYDTPKFTQKKIQSYHKTLSRRKKRLELINAEPELETITLVA